mmetsp:Transcript_12512/g.27940  ORF Transcript_12512/g.27940 Transcript_12512/m.27940 type:complete len:83 (-) Transcript_12512:636-884(-)
MEWEARITLVTNLQCGPLQWQRASTKWQRGFQPRIHVCKVHDSTCVAGWLKLDSSWQLLQQGVSGVFFPVSISKTAGSSIVA